jgi:regulator of protease activity HflC (stomatin/prohibitin superfamily)
VANSLPASGGPFLLSAFRINKLFTNKIKHGLGGQNTMMEIMQQINWWIVVLFIAICYIATILKIVSEKEMGIRILWGYIFPKPLKSGLHLIPWPMRITKVTKNAIKVDFGTLDVADTERANQANASQSWFIMQEPIRINWGDIQSSDNLSAEDRKQYENDPLAKRLTTDPHIYFIFKVLDLKNLVEVAGGLNEAMDRIKDTCITSLQEEAGKTFVAKAIKEIDSLSNKILKEVEWLVGDPDATERPGKTRNDSWGVDIKEVRVKDLGTSHAINIAISSRSAKVAEAAGDATATVLTADGDAYATKKNASANKFKSREEGKGVASAIQARAKAASEPGGDLVIKCDTLKEGLAHGKATILPLDLSILSAATSIKVAVDAVGKKEGE